MAILKQGMPVRVRRDLDHPMAGRVGRVSEKNARDGEHLLQVEIDGQYFEVTETEVEVVPLVFRMLAQVIFAGGREHKGT